MHGPSFALHLSIILLFAALLAPQAVRAGPDEDTLRNAAFREGHPPAQPALNLTPTGWKKLPPMTSQRTFLRDDCADGPNVCFGKTTHVDGEQLLGLEVRLHRF